MKVYALIATGLLVACSGAPANKPPDAGGAPPRVLAAVAVSCEAVELVVGAQLQCSATAADEHGAAMDGAAFEWRSSDEAVAVVDGSGRVTGVAEGQATLSATATLNGVTQSGEVTLAVHARQPTVHQGILTADETWRAADNPHHVTGTVVLSADTSPTLTIEPGVQLLFAPYTELVVSGGALRALGTEEAPIEMGPAEAEPFDVWTGLRLESGDGASELNHVTLWKCGHQGSCLWLAAAPVLRNVTVRESWATGISVSGRFGEGSAGIRIIDSRGVAARVAANSADSIPVDTEFNGNAENEVRVDSNIERSQTWPVLSVPYSVVGLVGIMSADAPVLTLQPGTEIRFARYAALLVGYEQPGSLVAKGTAEAPVRFVANNTSPTAGDWRGLHFFDAPQSALDHVVVSHAGDPGTGGSGAVNVYRELGAFITHTQVSHSDGCGIGAADGTTAGTTSVTTDFTSAAYGNSFTDNVGQPQCAF